MLLFFMPFFLFGDTTFITPMEYASSLYKNPRGIGCQKCHGDYGEGKIVANYIHKNENKSFVAPSINSIDFDRFYTALNVRRNGMPRYFLTRKEIQALYFYLQEKKKEGSEDDK
ncbi:cytochrome c [Sulfurimonas sp. RIFOXYD12_FULL_33_39]|uniref:c-type cytochrome n=1 Tax=unclassified Sulfurimonas TaxID=2623549 RepID=UPI00341B42DA